MALSPYLRRVARVAMPDLLRWPDIPVGAVRQVSVDVSDWAGQVIGDDPASVTAGVAPDDGGLAVSGVAVLGDVIGCTLTPATAGIGTDYAVTLTVTSDGGRIEPYTVRVLVTDPEA